MIAFILFNGLNIAIMVVYYSLMYDYEVDEDGEWVAKPGSFMDQNVLTVIYSVLCVIVAALFQMFVVHMTNLENNQY
jgi:hypothetical protein